MMAIRIFMILMCLAGTASAQSFGLLEVYDVPDGDVLNVRSGPSTDNEIVFTLSNGDTLDGFETTPDGRWTQIALPEGMAWVSSRFVRPIDMAFEESGLPIGLQCFGTEPFWRYEVLPDGESMYSELGGDRPYRSQVLSVLTSDNVALGSIQFDTDWHQVLLTHGECSDGMSDRRFHWNINLLQLPKRTRLITGCCTASVIQQE